MAYETVKGSVLATHLDFRVLVFSGLVEDLSANDASMIRNSSDGIWNISRVGVVSARSHRGTSSWVCNQIRRSCDNAALVSLCFGAALLTLGFTVVAFRLK
jgi:hypothetical protein